VTPIGRWLRGFTAPNPATLDPGNVDKNELYDAQTAAIMERVLERGSNCVDVGCHRGQILDEMLRVAPEGTHYAFEPLPHLHEELERKYAGHANVKLHRLALSEAAGETTFQHVVTNPAYSGILRRRYDRPDEEVVEIHVKLARLDDVVPKDLPIRLVKIDVEGAELGVLKGGLGILRRSRPYVVFEHGLGGSDHYGTRPEDVWNLVRGCGLRLSLMGGWLEGRRPLRLPELVDQFEHCRNHYFLAHP
jgi:FkbM family methyltransferase